MMSRRWPRLLPTLVLAILLAISSIGAACGRPSAADRDPPIVDGKRVPDNGAEDFTASGASGANGRGPGNPSRQVPWAELRPTTPPKVLVAGDSVALFLSIPIVQKATSFGIVAESKANLVCGLVKVDRVRHQSGELDQEVKNCRWPDQWAPKELAAFAPDIVLVAIGAPPIVDYEVGGTFVAPCDPAFDQWYAQQFAAAVDLFGSTGAFVAVANTAYPATYPVIPNGVERTDCLNRDMAAAITGKNAGIVDLNAWVCPAGKCDNTRNGVVLRPDGIHYTKEGADVVAAWLIPETLKVAGR